MDSLREEGGAMTRMTMFNKANIDGDIQALKHLHKHQFGEHEKSLQVVAHANVMALPEAELVLELADAAHRLGLAELLLEALSKPRLDSEHEPAEEIPDSGPLHQLEAPEEPEGDLQ